MPTYLEEILISHRARAADDGRVLGDLVEQAQATPRPGDFAAALGGDGLSCIAEIKRRSPSKGDLDPDLQADLVAKEYVAGGAACLSVLTDTRFFGGSSADLAAAKQASGLPALRKDFTVQEADVVDARLMGADAVLLIVAALDDDMLRRCAARAGELGLAALVEVLAVAESGIRDADDARRLAEAGYDAILVGETLLRSGDRVSQLRDLVGHPVGTR
jgi:indole-3-glycerol phosphate synthase